MSTTEININLHGIPARIQVDLHTADPLVWPEAKHQGLAIVEVDIDLLESWIGEEPEGNLELRRYAVAERAMEREIIEQIPDLETLDMVYRKGAGCSCGCSPAWCLPHHPGEVIYLTVMPVFAR